MNQADAIDIVQQAIWTVVIASGPAVAAAMAVGIVIALLQALTQVQEMTLTFVPKMLAIFIFAIIFMPFMLTTLSDFSHELSEKIVNIE